MIEPQPLSIHSHVRSVQLCQAFGVSRQELQYLADRDGLEQFAGAWGLDEAKKIALQLIISGKPEQKANAKSVIKQIAELAKADQ